LWKAILTDPGEALPDLQAMNFNLTFKLHNRRRSWEMARNRNAPARADAFSAGDLQDLEDGRMILRCATRDRYVVLLQATVRDRTLSFKARGILAFLLSHPDNWKFNLKHIEASSDRDGRDSIASGIKELISAGYARRVTTRAANGQIESKELQVAEEPVFRQLKTVATAKAKQEMAFPFEARTTTGSPQTGFPIQAATDPETDIPFEVDEPLQTGFPNQAEPQTAEPDTAFPEQAKPQLISTELTEQVVKKDELKETPPNPQTAAAQPSTAKPHSAAAKAGGVSKTAAKPGTGAGWTATGVGEWLTAHRRATPDEVAFVLGELAKKPADEIKTPNAYADRCLRSLRASEAQRRRTESLLALSYQDPPGEPCAHGGNNASCAQCSAAAEEARLRIREMVAALAAKQSA
jgi:hypothetical protein